MLLACLHTHKRTNKHPYAFFFRPAESSTYGVCQSVGKCVVMWHIYMPTYINFIHKHTHTHTRTRIHIRTHTHVHKCTHAAACKTHRLVESNMHSECQSVGIHTHKHIHAHTQTYKLANTHTHTHTHTYTHRYIHTHMHTRKHTHMHTHAHTHAQPSD